MFRNSGTHPLAVFAVHTNTDREKQEAARGREVVTKTFGVSLYIW